MVSRVFYCKDEKHLVSVKKEFKSHHLYNLHLTSPNQKMYRSIHWEQYKIRNRIGKSYRAHMYLLRYDNSRNGDVFSVWLKDNVKEKSHCIYPNKQY